MKTRNTILTAAVIAASIMFLIFTTNDSGAAQSPEGARTAALVAGVESKVRTEMDFVSSLNRPTPVPGLYDLSFRKYRNGVMEAVSSLPVRGGPLVLFAHVEDTNGNPAQSGTVTFEYCGDYEPKETCDAGSARWNRLGRISIGSCHCNSCGGLPDFDPGPGNACIFVFGTGGTGMEGDDGFRFKYAGSRGGVDSGTSGAANFTWTPAL
jgi:hypothetical protein